MAGGLFLGSTLPCKAGVSTSEPWKHLALPSLAALAGFYSGWTKSELLGGLVTIAGNLLCGTHMYSSTDTHSLHIGLTGIRTSSTCRSESFFAGRPATSVILFAASALLGRILKAQRGQPAGEKTEENSLPACSNASIWDFITSTRIVKFLKDAVSLPSSTAVDAQLSTTRQDIEEQKKTTVAPEQANKQNLTN